MQAIEQIGAVAGLASLLGLALLAFLYFAQARHVRDLEDKATFIPDELDLSAAATKPAAEPATTGAQPQAATKDKGKAATPATPPPTEAQAARQVEIARAKAERRKRFEQRRRTPGGRAPAADDGGRRMPEPRAMVAIGLGVAVLAIGIVFGAARILSSNNSSSSSSGGGGGGGAQSSKGNGTTGPAPEVSILNSTATAGLAATVGQQARGAGFKLGAVGDTTTPFRTSTVMFAPGSQATANQVAQKLSISQVQPMSSEVKTLARGAPVAVIVGQDRAGG